jgi:O-antigen/teichoic acid export membrane protein
MASLKKNFVYQTLYQVLAIVLPLISAPYIARVLGAENSGIYTYTNAIANYFVVFGMLGLEQYGNRCIARARNNYEDMCSVFSELLLLHFIIAVAVICVYFAYIIIFPVRYFSFFLIQGFYVVSALFDINWFFFGIENFKLTVVRNSIIKILSFAALFVFVKDGDDLGIYTFIMSFSVFLSQISTWPLLKKYVCLKKVKIHSLKRHIKPMIILFIAVIAANLNRMIDKVMLGWVGHTYALGCYDYADRIIRIPLSFIAAFGTVMLSKMSNLFAANDTKEANKLLDMSACLILMLSFAMGGGIAAIAPEFVALYLGEAYKETGILLTILALSIPLVGWNNFVRTQMLIPKQLDGIYTKAVLSGAITNILINCVLINLFSARGAAVATVISYFVISVIQTVCLIKDTYIKQYLEYAVYPLSISVVMYFLVRCCSAFTNSGILNLLIEIGVGTVFYGFSMIIYLKIKKPTIIRAVLKRAKTKG